MDRKSFIRKSILGAGAVVSPAIVRNIISKEHTVLSRPDIVGFNHLPYLNSVIMENTVLHKAATRGHASHGWLESYHSFSFAGYFNPDRMNFGALRVLNDDRVDPGMGFGTHRHDNMEIISIPLEGDLEHKDSMGNTAVIKKGDIQVMSAGSGISHSEYNRNADKLTKFLQIWVIPDKKNVTPRYDQITLHEADRQNKLQQILSPDADDEGVWINQQAWFHMGKFDEGFKTTYSLKKEGNGIYAFVLKGDITIAGTALQERDALGIWNTGSIKITANSANAEILLMEVPMEF